MKLVVDRFEGNFAVCEKDDRTMISIEKKKLPEEVKEGDVLLVEGNVFIIDERETASHKAEAKKLMDELWK